MLLTTQANLCNNAILRACAHSSVTRASKDVCQQHVHQGTSNIAVCMRTLDLMGHVTRPSLRLWGQKDLTARTSFNVQLGFSAPGARSHPFPSKRIVASVSIRPTSSTWG